MHLSGRQKLGLVAGLWFAIGIPLPVAAQSSTEIDNLAIRTTDELIKTKPTALVVAPRETCNLALPICETFDSAFRADIQQAVPQIRIIGRAEAAADLKKNRLLAIDVYNPIALRLIALSENAEAVVTEDLLWEKDGYRLRIDIRDPRTDGRVVPFHTLELRLPRSGPDTSENPMLVKDPDTNVSVIVFKGPLPKKFVYPGCNKCPDPHSIGGQGIVQVIATITDQGKAESVTVVSSPSPAFTKAALDTLQGWTFKPASGSDGKAFATRGPIEINFAR